MALPGRATMDFFESQASARRKTALLVVLFSLAVLLTIAGVYLAVVVACAAAGKVMQGWWHPWIFYNAVAWVAIVILGGTVYKIIDLWKGGSRVAELLGGVRVHPNTTDAGEQRLLNVVQEMAIASGVPVPAVYILPQEKGINAFAAGFTPQDAVVAVTRGCLQALSRDELQGVVAHEFSHILNGDMALNLRLMGVVNGLLVLALIGRTILDSKGRGRSRGRSKGAGAIFLFAFLLMVVGYIGVFFGNLIKSAVSRQREFLADAAAVQFTRNPGGIAGALRKIAGWTGGSLVANPRAEEASHLFFGDGMKDRFLAFFRSHPPLRERIRRIEMAYPEAAPGRSSAAGGGGDGNAVSEPLFADAGIQALAASVRLDPERFLASVGNTQAPHVAYAREMVTALPPAVVEAARDPLGAQSLVFCLLLCEKERTGEKTKDWEDRLDPAVGREIARLRPSAAGLGREHLLPLVDMAWPALRNLSKAQYGDFRVGLQRLIDADRKVDLFEFAVRSLLTNRLDAFFGLAKPRRIRYRVLDQVQVEVFELLSILARQGSRIERDAGDTFQKAMEALDAAKSHTILAREKCGLSLLDKTLARLAETSFDLRKRILNACLLCIVADRQVTIEEAELFRAVAENLDCPVPPVIPQTLPAAA
mgnify:CR=1 FL=1